jgi:metal-responsive CopG/Arc/MetJ family transcriptional regulator
VRSSGRPLQFINSTSKVSKCAYPHIIISTKTHMIMETIIVKAKSKRLAEEVIKKLKKIQGLQIQTSKTWLALDRSLPSVY